MRLSVTGESTPQPLYNTTVGVHGINGVISKQKCIDYIEK